MDEPKSDGKPNRRRPEPFTLAGQGATLITALVSAIGLNSKLDGIALDVATIKAERKVDAAQAETNRRISEDLARRVIALERIVDRLADHAGVDRPREK